MTCCCRLPFVFLATFLLSLFHAGQWANALDPRFELDPRELQQKLPPTDLKAPSAKKKTAVPRTSSGQTYYTVKPVDHLKKIRKRVAGTGLHGNNPRTKRAYHKAPGHEFTLIRNAPDRGYQGIESTRIIWGKILPEKRLANETVSIKGNNYSLDLAPDRFPLFPAADGGMILIEAGDKLSPIVKSLIQDHEPGIRFVTYTPHDRRRFFSDLLAAAGFYSVEENFTVSFGTDPKLTISTDFKVENDSDSPLQHDIFLLNIGRRQGGFPAPLNDYLARQGFRVIDLYPDSGRERPQSGNRISVVRDGDPNLLADGLMDALGVGYEINKEIELLSMREGGVALSVRADRYFEKGGEKFVVSIFRGDLENYTLLRLLESQRYHVIVLTPDESLRSIAGKFMSQLRLHGQYAMQDLLASRDLPYSIQMSGLMVDGPGKRGKTFMTTVQPDTITGELLELNGYTIRDDNEKITRK